MLSGGNGGSCTPAEQEGLEEEQEDQGLEEEQEGQEEEQERLAEEQEGLEEEQEMGVVQPMLSLLPSLHSGAGAGQRYHCCVRPSGGLPLGLDAWLEGSPGGPGERWPLQLEQHLDPPADRRRKAGSVSCEASKSGQTPVAQTLNPDQC
ncbi:hypothetical protein N1851_004819 [Merluccius polli]|uniref:Uncharacterized protein n=1 Tax=Merluccius polli TaxID=89951 RepID=A0AA47N6R5_MERPO|nr:hypothetical protein N1851_004819 [Merluccius polli]